MNDPRQSNAALLTYFINENYFYDPQKASNLSICLLDELLEFVKNGEAMTQNFLLPLLAAGCWTLSNLCPEHSSAYFSTHIWDYSLNGIKQLWITRGKPGSITNDEIRRALLNVNQILFIPDLDRSFKISNKKGKNVKKKSNSDFSQDTWTRGVGKNFWRCISRRPTYTPAANSVALRNHNGAKICILFC